MFDVTERRIKISKLLVDGLKPYQIKDKFPDMSIEQIYDDIKTIKKKSLKTMIRLSKDGLAFNYDLMTQQLELIYNETRNKLINNKDDITIDEFCKLNKLARETITEKRELLKESLSVFEIDKLKQDVKELKEQQQGTNVRSFMNPNDLPSLKHNNILTK